MAYISKHLLTCCEYNKTPEILHFQLLFFHVRSRPSNQICIHKKMKILSPKWTMRTFCVCYMHSMFKSYPCRLPCEVKVVFKFEKLVSTEHKLKMRRVRWPNSNGLCMDAIDLLILNMLCIVGIVSSTIMCMHFLFQ